MSNKKIQDYEEAIVSLESASDSIREAVRHINDALNLAPDLGRQSVNTYIIRDLESFDDGGFSGRDMSIIDLIYELQGFIEEEKREIA